MRQHFPELLAENAEGMFAEYDLRWCERLANTLVVLSETPRAFQDWVDEKTVGARELSPLLAAPEPNIYHQALTDLIALGGSKSQVLQALEWLIELNLMGHPLHDILPSDKDMANYLRKLEKWRRPRTSEQDERWREVVHHWPWPAQVQGQWLRFGDQAGLEIKMRTTSPRDFQKKLLRLVSIGEFWQNQPGE
jgi:hypothetical protein